MTISSRTLMLLAISLIGAFTNIASINPCGLDKPLTINETEGIISSPRYDGKTFYPPNSNCSWTLSANISKVIHVEFLNFSIEYSFDCLFDGLLIFDGNTSDSEVLLHGCGQRVPKNVSSTGSSLHLVFYSDDVRSDKGFVLQFRHAAPHMPCDKHQLTCQNNNCVNQTLICNREDDCGDGTDEEECGYKLLRRLQCGQPVIKPDLTNDRIIGGTKAVPGSWPWQVSFRFRLEEPYGHVCGGSLINEQWVLSAAHCFYDVPKVSWSVHFGKHYKYKQDSTEQVRYIKKLFIHPHYIKMLKDEKRTNHKDNDIALIQLNAPVSLTPSVQPICLVRNYISQGILAYVTGWGATLGTGHSDVLKQAAVPIVSHQVCKKAYDGIFPIRKTMICAGYKKGGEDSCKGDSGGPLVVFRKGTWYLSGIVSSGGNCAEALKPGVYTRVSSYIKWIKKLIWKYQRKY